MNMFDSNKNSGHENRMDQNIPENTEHSRSGNGSPAAGGQSGTIWNGESYHGTPTSGTEEKQPYSSYHAYSTYSSRPDEDWQTRGTVDPHGTADFHSDLSAGVTNGMGPKRKKHIFRNVLVGVLACMVVSAGSIATFAALINNGTIKLQSASTTNPAFTIVHNSSSNSAKTTDTSASNGTLTKQQVAQKIIPSVVCIENYSSTTARDSIRGNGGGTGNDGTAADGTGAGEVSPSSEGSGIIATSDGYIITNAHVVSGATKLKVVLSSGKTYVATLIGSDSITDLALIKVDATDLTAAEFGSSKDMQVADSVMAVGNPAGLELSSSVTVGYVSALNREITNSETGYTMKCIQTDAAINPGNSGGALVNMKGQVVGINSSKIATTGYEGLGFAIPIDTAQPVISQIKQYGYVKDRAVLGITGQFVDSMTARFSGLPSGGFYVVSIASEYVTSAGIQKGDLITKIDDKDVSSESTIASVVASKKPGDTVTLTVLRPSAGKTFTALVKLSQATGKT